MSDLQPGDVVGLEVGDESHELMVAHVLGDGTVECMGRAPGSLVHVKASELTLVRTAAEQRALREAKHNG